MNRPHHTPAPRSGFEFADLVLAFGVGLLVGGAIVADHISAQLTACPHREIEDAESER